jgi:hypothetical protein
MDISDRLRQEVREWMTSAGRECPRCKASPEFIEITEIDHDALHPSACGPHGIDTSKTCHKATLRCKCGFEGMLILEDVGLM